MKHVLTINAGSSSIKSALYEVAALPDRSAVDMVERARLDIPAGGSATKTLIDWIESQPAFRSVHAIGHRVVHGMQHSEPMLVTPALLQELRAHPALRPGPLAAGDRADRSIQPSASRAATGGLLRYGVSSRHAAQLRNCCLFPAATGNRACNVTGSTACRTPT